MTARIRLPKKLSPKPAPHLFPPLFAVGKGERERERDIIGIPGVRLPRRPFHPPSLSISSRVGGLSTPCQRFRAFVVGDGPLTDSSPTINHRLQAGGKRRPRGHGSVNLHSRTTLSPRLIMLPSIKRVAAFTASENPIIGRRNNAFRYRVRLDFRLDRFLALFQSGILSRSLLQSFTIFSIIL